MKLLQQFNTCNQYSGSNWDFEQTNKYIFELSGKTIEAGYFIHYKEGNVVKKVIELSSSYGCPMKCKFCASSSIDDFCNLSAQEIFDVFDFIYRKNNLAQDDYVLVTLTGVGELFYTIDNVCDFIRLSNIKYRNLWYTVSSVAFNEKIYNKISGLPDDVRIRYIQLTYLSCDPKKAAKIVPNLSVTGYDFQNIVRLIQESPFKNFRINYILIHNFNDSMEEFNKFKELILPIREHLTVRISKLNETQTTIRNRLDPATESEMRFFSDFLKKDNISNYIFYSEKNDNMNCGQLISENIQ